MDAGVVSGLLQLATLETLFVEEVSHLKSVASKRPATASGCGGAGPSAASPLLSDAPRHRLRRVFLHPTRGARNAAHTLFQQPARERRFGPRSDSPLRGFAGWRCRRRRSKRKRSAARHVVSRETG